MIGVSSRPVRGQALLHVEVCSLGGDCVTGPDLVVTAMAAGRRAARAIDEYLKNHI